MAKFLPTKIIVHHSLTLDSGTVSWGAIRRFHIKTREWKDIGYHVGVELVKSGEESYFEALLGRMWDRRGAHCKGHNRDSLSICFIGNYDVLPPPKKMLEAGAKVIALWLDFFCLSINDVYSHHYFDIDKSCPGKLFDMEILKGHIRRCYD